MPTFLSTSLNVYAEKQEGGGVVIRGFEASRVLLMVDGVRMNNAIYRAGSSQNLITVDHNILTIKNPVWPTHLPFTEAMQ
jgi:hemoglobin/transferrin/lactoferrin receptor protein